VVVQVVERQLSKCKPLSSNSSTATKKRKKERKKMSALGCYFGIQQYTLHLVSLSLTNCANANLCF
jgi:hypothetical protein